MKIIDALAVSAAAMPTLNDAARVVQTFFGPNITGDWAGMVYSELHDDSDWGRLEWHDRLRLARDHVNAEMGGAEWLIAQAFCNAVREAFSADELAEINARNASADSIGCATQDFADANEIMAGAWETALGRPVDLPAIGAGDVSPEADMWNRAWTMARESGFDPGKI
ncbi:hypothetical protein GQE99_06620 [Maritimibacter sp. DP07]|uniref:Uncharacterized protein n=1 Tax=Maritimibacter harenae TaxID=2606218 RepID=A0A845M5E9_9RHOB|nr:hypothetical protein [Maritimibacter harenae]MZR12693.1 hypothetical protein [Maritimibacter harenae]